MREVQKYTLPVVLQMNSCNLGLKEFENRDDGYYERLARVVCKFVTTSFYEDT